MGARFSRLTDTITKRRRRSLTPVDAEELACTTHNRSIETGHDPAVHGATLEDRNYNNEAFKRRTVEAGEAPEDTAALKIQKQFRQGLAKEEVEELRKDDAAAKIQAGFRGFIDRGAVRKMRDEMLEKAQAEKAQAQMKRRSESKSTDYGRSEDTFKDKPEDAPKDEADTPQQ